MHIILYYKHIAMKEVCECKIILSSYLSETSKHGVLRLKESEDGQLLCRVVYIPMCYSNTIIQEKEKFYICVIHTNNP